MTNTSTNITNQQLTLFKSDDGNISADVILRNDTVWLNQKQMSAIFDKDSDTIGLHIKNIFTDGELDSLSTTEDFSVVQTEGSRKVTRKVKYYNLDLIISVGYRVNSKRGIEFRRWANSVLKDYLLKGYAINHNVIDTTNKEYQNLISLLGKTLINNQLIDQQGQNIIELINNYATTWSTLLQYDEDRLALPANVHKTTLPLEYSNAINAINELKNKLAAVNEATALFGNERSENLQSILANLDQTMFGDELYKSVEEKAANLLYMVIKDHPFSDGNKRIGSFLFVLYLQLNHAPVRIDDIGLTSLALLIAESNPNQKDLIIRLVINLITK